MKKTSKVLLHLSLVQGVGSASVFKLLKSIQTNSSAEKVEEFVFEEKNLDDLYSYSEQDFCRLGIQTKTAQSLFTYLRDTSQLEEEIKLIEKYKIDLITILDEDYPKILKQIHTPPTVLYCRGAKLNSFKKNIAIVGARKAGNYAKAVSDHLVKGLVDHGWNTISGGAIGVDAMVHKATLAAGGKTVAVLGSGLMEPYPLKNKELFRDIIKSGGVVVSSFPLKMLPLKENFPARNRIIAGLGRGCLLVQAAQKSGARITAQFALEEGKVVFAVPGLVCDELSVGCHELIKEGAKLTSSLQDILEEFGETVVHEEEFVEDVEIAANVSSSKKSKEEKTKKRIIKFDDPILRALDDSMSLDELGGVVDMDMVELQGKLFELQLEGKVKQNFAGSWERTIH